MNYYIEEYSQNKHLHLLSLMKLSKESRMETEVSPLCDIGLSPQDILYDCVIGSAESFVVRCKDSRRIRGVFGCSQQITPQCTIAVPWFLSDGFEREPENIRQFLLDSTLIVSNWRRTSKCRRMFNYCLSDRRIMRWLRRLGFTVSNAPVRIRGIPMRAFWWDKT